MTQERQAILRLAIVLVALLGAAACVPTITLEEYRRSFGVMRTTATDLYIQTGFYAKELADDPMSNDLPSVRAQKYTERVIAIGFRQDALKVINQYNDVLAALATGSDPKAVEGSLQSIKTGIEALRIDQISKIITPVVPYIGIIADAIALIDDAIKAKKFKEAAVSAEKPLIGILRILNGDADSIQDIVDARLERIYNRHRGIVSNARFTFQATANTFNNQPAVNDPNVPTVADLQKRMDGLLATLELWPGETKLNPMPRRSGQTTPKPADISGLSALLDNVERNIEIANQAVSKRAAHEGYTNQSFILNGFKHRNKVLLRNF